MLSIDDEWSQYIKNVSTISTIYNSSSSRLPPSAIIEETPPINPIESCIPSQLYDLHISTKTKVLYLNQQIDIHSIFWKIPIIEYWQPIEGIVKKQIKIVSTSEEEYEEYKKKLVGVHYYKEHIIKQINSTTNLGRGKYKDERKITIGVSKKDIMNCRGKVKNAFYNCFAIIIRFKHEGLFREIHVKVFNTGKMEIPGILNIKLLEVVKKIILTLLRQFVVVDELLFVEKNDKDENVLINSNFNCGFYINREKLHHLINKKYGIETSFDPCTYPGVKCKYYFNNHLDFDHSLQTGRINIEDRSMKMNELSDNEKYTEVSFMIFRTGSCLIVGNCSEKILYFIYHFLKNILITEYSAIYVINEDVNIKQKKTKIRKRNISVTRNYLKVICKK
jgi:hypothetical protein